MLVGAGGSYAVGATGGEATHTLTVAEMPSHSHGYRLFTPAETETNATSPAVGKFAAAYRGAGYNNSCLCGDGGSSSENHMAKTGSSAAHNNMPPYLAVYMWKRTA